MSGTSLTRRLLAIWFQGAPVPWWAAVLERVHLGVHALRRVLKRMGLSRPQRLAVPVIVVGNLIAGGAGKTPMVLWLVEHLRTLGLRVGVISRGYGSTLRHPRPVRIDGHADESGDEPLLIRRRLDVPVWVGVDRVAAGRALTAAENVDVIVSDDGLQHARLHRDLEIIVLDGRRGFGNGRLIPAGPLREPLSRLEKGALCIVNGPSPAHLPSFGLRPTCMQRLDDGTRQSLTTWHGRDVVALAGIGDPARFFDTLRRAGLVCRTHPFPDHHRFTAADLSALPDLTLVMTEKDAVKCVGIAPADSWFLRVDARPEAAFVAELDRKLALMGLLDS